MISPRERDLIESAAGAAYQIPFIDDIEDFVWEVIWAYSQGLPTPESDRSKRLFDVVDERQRIGWSAKTLVWGLDKVTCEFVIQRADVVKKAALLGFPGLSLMSPADELGAAVLEHWRMKVDADKAFQGVDTARLALLLKSRDRRTLVPYEEELHVPSSHQVEWHWTDQHRSGLQGFENGELRFRWYPNQKQLFEIIPLRPSQPRITIAAERLTMQELIRRVVS